MIFVALIIFVGLAVTALSVPMIKYASNRPVNGEYKKVQIVDEHCKKITSRFGIISPQKAMKC